MELQEWVAWLQTELREAGWPEYHVSALKFELRDGKVHAATFHTALVWLYKDTHPSDPEKPNEPWNSVPPPSELGDAESWRGMFWDKEKSVLHITNAVLRKSEQENL